MNPNRVAFWTFAGIAGALQTWGYRFWIEPDGVNYLDIASAYARHDWPAAINTYWSPLYSWLLAGVFSVLHPSMHWESTVLHVVNFVIFLAALYCGQLFLAELNVDRREGLLPSWALWWIGCCILLFVSLFMNAVYLDTPDLLTSAFVYLAAALLVRIRDGRANSKAYILFGLVLAFAYFAKTIMFLGAFAFLIAGARRRAILASAACFAIASAAWILLMAHAVKRFTYGDSGWTNYVMYVASSGAAIHPPRVLVESPEVREFAMPIRATYPPWYDHAYWFQGLRPHFAWSTQLRAISTTMREYFTILSGMKEFILALLLLWIADPALPNIKWALLLPPMAAFGLYAVVGHVEPRLVGAFFVILWLPVFAGLRVHESEGKIVRYVVLLVVAITVFKVSKAAIRTTYSVPNVQWETAAALRTMGVSPGSEIAYFGDPTVGEYWARLGGFRIAADIQNGQVPLFWSATSAMQNEILHGIAASGISAVVALDAPRVDHWQPIVGTPYSVYLFARQ